jgi:hypothetical protein
MSLLARSWRTSVVIATCALVGCASNGSASDPHALATLTVHIAAFGGPPRIGGGMALSDAPQRGKKVTAIDTNGGEHTAWTDTAGIATMHLAAGSYTVSGYCLRPRPIVLQAGRISRIEVPCQVP